MFVCVTRDVARGAGVIVYDGVVVTLLMGWVSRQVQTAATKDFSSAVMAEKYFDMAELLAALGGDLLTCEEGVEPGRSAAYP